jgi:2-polyprenyl-6-methoxyphenol hydroxylase-like FAD-dependent oxidoreductase
VLPTPANPVGGLALLMEDRRWLVSAAGFADHRPPRDVEGFETFLRALPDRAIADVAARAAPLGDVAVYRQTANRRHRYERVPDWPDGLLAVGDAFCTFDPIYGQGITVAALEAVLLRDVLGKAQADGGLEPGWSAGLLRRFGRIVDLPWAVATGEDRRFLPGNQQTRGQRLLGVWTRRLDRMAAHGDGFARQQLARVYNLLASPAALFHPRLVASAARAVVLGEGEPCPRPASLEALAGAAAPAGP